jgi:hypothetical protein
MDFFSSKPQIQVQETPNQSENTPPLFTLQGPTANPALGLSLSLNQRPLDSQPPAMSIPQFTLPHRSLLTPPVPAPPILAIPANRPRRSQHTPACDAATV